MRLKGKTQGFAGERKRESANRKLPLYERVTGVEPAALGLGSRCSTTELHPQCYANVINLTHLANILADFLIHGTDNG